MAADLNFHCFLTGNYRRTIKAKGVLASPKVGSQMRRHLSGYERDTAETLYRAKTCRYVMTWCFVDSP
jgi:hypothetical protein